MYQTKPGMSTGQAGDSGQVQPLNKAKYLRAALIWEI